MRIIIHPLGFITILVSIAALFGMVLLRPQKSPPTAAMQNGATVEASRAATGASAMPGPLPSSSSLASGVLLSPDIVSKDWGAIIGSGTINQHIVNCSVPDHPYARHIDVITPGKDPWEQQLLHPINVALKQGKTIRLSFWGRSKVSKTVGVVVEKIVPPLTGGAYKKVNLSPNWQPFTLDWVQQENTDANWAKIDFQLGFGAGDVELTGVTIREL